MGRRPGWAPGILNRARWRRCRAVGVRLAAWRRHGARRLSLTALILAVVVVAAVAHLSEDARARWQLPEFLPVLASAPTASAGHDLAVSLKPVAPAVMLEQGLVLDLRQAPPPLVPTHLPGRAPVILFVHQGASLLSITTTRTTVGSALAAGRVVVRPYDHVVPFLTSLLGPGMHVYIYPAKLITILHGDSAASIHTPVDTVGQALERAGVVLGQRDRVEPGVEALLQEGMSIKVIRVREETDILEETVPRTTLYRDDPNLERGRTLVLDAGQDGIRHRRVRITYENGHEVGREVVEAWWEREPRTSVVARGVRPPVYTLETPYGTIRYTGALRVYATWYNASDGGKAPSDPRYGLTATGVRVDRGIVAVDPRVIPFGTRLYIPGYGLGVAADTGGGIVGQRIDLGHPEGVVPDWETGWVTVYILAP